MTSVNISTMTLEDLEAYEIAVQKQINVLKEKQKPINDAREIINEILADSKLTLEEIYPELFKSKKDTKRKKRSNSLKGSKLPILWKNPDDESETWKGRGKRPAWLDPAIERYSEEECKVLENW
jgi:DNA-binding protein H-NS